MDKVIKMMATKVQSASKFEKYLLQVTEQSYIRCAFGNPSGCFTSSKGFILKSMGQPAIGASDKLFVRGNRTYTNDYTLTVSTQYLVKVMHAVREYNSHLIITDLLVIPDEESFVIE